MHKEYICDWQMFYDISYQSSLCVHNTFTCRFFVYRDKNRPSLGYFYFLQCLWFLLTDFNNFSQLKSVIISAHIRNKIYHLTLSTCWHSDTAV